MYHPSPPLPPHTLPPPLHKPTLLHHPHLPRLRLYPRFHAHHHASLPNQPSLLQRTPENLERLILREHPGFPAIDVLICTADLHKEPPMNVMNTALSVMAYDYATEKVSVYVSDDGGSDLTLFAFMEAANFVRSWLPFCRENKIVERCPEVFFQMDDDHSRFNDAEKIMIMYQAMKVRVNNVIRRGKVESGYVTGERERQAFRKWTNGFTPRDHPTIIEVLLDSSKDKDMSDNVMQSLVYVAREKSSTSQHNFKAGALNVLEAFAS